MLTRSVNLVGLDFGTTTTSAVVATARLSHNDVLGRAKLTGIVENRSEMVFTPIREGELDLDRIAGYLQDWFSDLECADIFGGGALLTGLTAQKANASGLIRLIEERLEAALIATADDPRFEAWVAFMGNCSRLSRDNPKTHIINLDLGGGTTNIAIGKDGEVLETGCLLVGARHVQVEPGTYRIKQLSDYAEQLFDHLGISRGPGESLSARDVDQILDFYLVLLESAISGDRTLFQDPIARQHENAPFRLPAGAGKAVVTLSGGVGHLVYEHLKGRPWPATTAFGDLGIDLARRISEIPAWADDFEKYVPETGGRATVYGLLEYSTRVSGSTLFLPNAAVLPLRNVPVLGSISMSSTDNDISRLLDLVARSPTGGCLRVKFHDEKPLVSEFGKRLGKILEKCILPKERTLLLLMEENLGKVLGNCATNWGRNRCNLLVIDEIELNNAQFVHVGRLKDQVLPVSFHGMSK